MTEPADPEDPDLRIEVLELLTGLLIGQLRAVRPAALEAVELALRRYVRAEAPRAGAEPTTREMQVAGRILEQLEVHRTGDAGELLAEISDR